MIAFDNVYSRAYAEGIACGSVDSDLERLQKVIVERIDVRDGIKRCPECGELLRVPHEHGGIRYALVEKSTAAKVRAASV